VNSLRAAENWLNIHQYPGELEWSLPASIQRRCLVPDMAR